MAERSFRVVLQNDSTLLSLNQSFNHLCGGEWTPGWAPPGTIGPAASGGIQAESNGFMTGTEGYAKYDVMIGSSKQGMIYLYWDNPWYGVTRFRFATAANDVYPDCDFDPPSEGSGFPDDAKLDFTLKMASYKLGTDFGDQINDVADLNAYILGPVSFLGLLGITKNPELDLRLIDAVDAPPVLVDLGSDSYRLLTKATLDQWVGRWTSSNPYVTVDVSRSGSQLIAEVVDKITTPTLSFIEPFIPGSGGILSSVSPSIDTLLKHQVSSADRAIFHSAVKKVLEHAAKAPTTAAQAAKHFQTVIAESGGALSNEATRIIGRVIGKMIQPQGGIAYLSHHIALQLYARIQDGRQTGIELQYQRLNTLGSPTATVMLEATQVIK